MASVEAASALLTAESILVAAFSIGLQHFPDPDKTGKSVRKPIAIMTALFTAVSFLCSIAYLHAAEFPYGIVANTFSVKIYFNVAVVSLLAIVYTALSLIYMEQIGYDYLMEEPDSPS